MNADFLFKNETEKILSCSFEVHNEVGCGYREKAYERALVREFQLRQIPYDQQKQFPLFYKDTQIDVFIPDLIAWDKIIVDTKTIEHIGDQEKGQMLNYLRITGLEVGLILNFKKPRLEYKRIALQKPRTGPGPRLQS